VHFTGLEGIRALAASMVVVHHAVSFAGPDRAGPLDKLGAIGDMGVGLFFVLSGFLIYRPFAVAGLDGSSPQRALSFLWRRVLRIVPAYWLVLTVFWIAGSYDLGPPSEAWRYYAFLQIYDAATALGGITIAWSLNTEMTFYLLVPVWAWLVRRVLGQGRTTLALEAGCLAALGIGGYVARMLFTQAPDMTRSLSFLWLPANLDLFAAGMLMAVLHAWITGPGRDSPWAGRVHRVLGGAPIVWAAAFVALYALYAWKVGPAPFETGYQGFAWQRRQFVVSLLAAFLIAPMVFGRSGDGTASRDPVRRFWELKPIHWVGLVSYGLYLWHFPFMQRVPDHAEPNGTSWEGWAGTPPGNTSLLFLLAVGFGLGLLGAAASYYALEKPTQRFKRLL
jgi:peptidoglycan/LPS O-acetylase OafA/YrhL